MPDTRRSSVTNLPPNPGLPGSLAGSRKVRPLPPQRGVALLMVLFALALIALGLPVVLEQSRTEVKQMQGLHDGRQALALHRAAQLLVEEGLTERRWRESALFSKALQGQWLDMSLAGIDTELVPDASVRIRLQDRRACFNVNALAGPEAAEAREQLLFLLRSRGAGDAEQLADRLADWVDADNQRMPRGAESQEYLQSEPARLPAQTALVDISELNLLLPADSSRSWRYPELCALADTGAWKLNLNALTPDQLPLLEALYQGEVSTSVLSRLLLRRPEKGYADAEEVRAVLAGAGAEQISTVLGGLLLNSEFFRLQTEVELNGERYTYQQDLQARGVSKWAALVPAQRISWQLRQRLF